MTTRQNAARYHLYEVHRVVRFRDRKQNGGGQGLWGGDSGESVFTGGRVSVLQDQAFWRWIVVMAAHIRNVLSTIAACT